MWIQEIEREGGVATWPFLAYQNVHLTTNKTFNRYCWTVLCESDVNRGLAFFSQVYAELDK